MPVFPTAAPGPQGFKTVSAAEVARNLAAITLIDVREPSEWNDDVGHAAGARLVPLSTWPAGAASIDRQKPIVVVCRSGMRSARAAAHLVQTGAAEVYNLAGGMMAWAQAGLPVERA